MFERILDVNPDYGSDHLNSLEIAESIDSYQIFGKIWVKKGFINLELDSSALALANQNVLTVRIT